MEKGWPGLAPSIVDILQQLEAAERPLPLVSGRRVDPRAAQLLQATSANEALSTSRSPEAAMAGLWLLAGDWERAHEIAQDLASAEGSYWHALVHRMEPDAWNSGYWFRRVGVHPVFAPLRLRAAELSAESGVRWDVPDRWDPIAFIDYCEQARRKAGSAEEALAEEVQRAEWNLLFSYCAQGA